MLSNAARLYFLIFPITFVVAILLKMGYDNLHDLTDPSDTMQKSVWIWKYHSIMADRILNIAIFAASMTLVLVCKIYFHLKRDNLLHKRVDSFFSGVFDSVYRRGETERNVQETAIRTASEVDEENISKIIVWWCELTAFVIYSDGKYLLSICLHNNAFITKSSKKPHILLCFFLFSFFISLSHSLSHVSLMCRPS